MSGTTTPDTVSLLAETVETALSAPWSDNRDFQALERDCKRTVVQIFCANHLADQKTDRSPLVCFEELTKATADNRHALKPIFNTDLPFSSADRADLISHANKHVNFDTSSFFDHASDLIEAFSAYEIESITDGVTYRAKGDDRRVSATYLTPTSLATATADQPLRQWVVTVINSVDTEAPLLTDVARTHPHEFLDAINRLSLVDPAVGTGSMLLGALETLVEPTAIALAEGEDPTDADRQTARTRIVEKCFYGVDINTLAVETTLAVLWAQVAVDAETQGPNPKHFASGEALLGPVRHQTVAEFGTNDTGQTYREDVTSLNWGSTFPEVFQDGGFDVVVTNPPWERLKVQSREFFATRRPELASQATSADRNAELAYDSDAQASLQTAREQADAFANAVRESPHYDWTNVGSLNLYSLFAERSLQLINDAGVSGLLVPTGIATDYYTRDFFAHLLETGRLLSLHDFENREKLFADIDGRTRFSIVTLQATPGESVAEFSFFSQNPEELDTENGSVRLTAQEVRELNPNTCTVPLVRGHRELELLRQLHDAAPVLSRDTSDGDINPWGVTYHRMFDMSGDSEHFISPNAIESATPTTKGHLETSATTYTRVYEGRMTDIYNHRAASAKDAPDNLYRSGKSENVSESSLSNPDFTVAARYYVPLEIVDEYTADYDPAHEWFLTFKDITSATNARTMRASVVPYTAVGNKLPILNPNAGARRASCFLANLNSMVYDFACRQKIGNVSLNWYIVRQTPVLEPSVYDYNIGDESLETWISRRVAELTYTAHDLDAWGKALQFQSVPYEWNQDRRRTLRAELDALYGHLYGLSWPDMDHILESFTTIARRERNSRGHYAYKECIREAYEELNGCVPTPASRGGVDETFDRSS